MNVVKLAVCALGFILLQNSASAQCGCGAYSAPTVMRQMPAYTMPAYTMPARTHASAPRSPGSISYVNELSQPIDRGSYVLRYAIHLTDGRILLSDFLPRGQAIRGVEYQSRGRKMVAGIGGNGAVTVTDPTNNSVVATFAN